MQIHFLPHGQTGDLGVRSKDQISLNFNYKVNFKEFIPNFACVPTNKRYEIYRTEFSFILSPESCPRGGTLGYWEVKNLSVGICDGAQSTVRSCFTYS